MRELSSNDRLVEACRDCKPSRICPVHNEYIDRRCLTAHPTVRYGGKTNAQRFAERYGPKPRQCGEGASCVCEPTPCPAA